MKSKTLSAIALSLALTMTVTADDAKPKKGAKGGGNPAATQMLKQFEAVGLTEDQIAKVKEVAKKMGAESKSILEGAGITPDVMKKRAEATKAMKDSGKKGKELAAAVDKEAGLTEAQAEAMKKVAELRMKYQNEVIGMLTQEQKDKLPARLTGGGKPDAKPKKKKKNE